MRLTRDEIVRSKDEHPLELFRQGIRAVQTREKYERTLRMITCKILDEVLEGDFEERVEQMVKHSREDPGWILDLMLNLSRKMRERTELPLDHQDYFNPSSFSNYFKPLKKLFDMTGVAIAWNRLYATYPEMNNMDKSRDWTRAEIAKMLEHARDEMERALILVLASSGARIGGLVDLNWGDLTAVYWSGDEMTLDPGAEDAEIACVAMKVYSGSAEDYMAFMTPEAYKALQAYGPAWVKRMERVSKESDPIWLTRKRYPGRASDKVLRQAIGKAAVRAGLRVPMTKPVRKGMKHEVPIMNGFRRFNNKTCKESLSPDSTLASLIKKEFMLGHQGTTSLDKNYFKTSMLELAREYATVVPDLTIRDTQRLKESNRRMSANIQKLESEKDVQIAELQKKMVQTEKMMDKAARTAGNRSGKDARIAELEKKVAGLEGLREKSIAVKKVIKRPKKKRATGIVTEETDTLNALLRQLETTHKNNLEEIRAEKDMEIAELKKVVAGALRRAGIGDDVLSGHESKKARRKRSDEHKPKGTHPHHERD